MPNGCCVVNCRTRSKRGGVGFYSIPAILNFPHKPHLNELSRLRRQKWIAALKRKNFTDKQWKYAKVCGNHFLTGAPSKLTEDTDPDWIPSINIKCEKPKKKDVTRPSLRRGCKRREDEEYIFLIHDTPTTHGNVPKTENMYVVDEYGKFEKVKDTIYKTNDSLESGATVNRNGNPDQALIPNHLDHTYAGHIAQPEQDQSRFCDENASDCIIIPDHTYAVNLKPKLCKNKKTQVSSAIILEVYSPIDIASKKHRGSTASDCLTMPDHTYAVDLEEMKPLEIKTTDISTAPILYNSPIYTVLEKSKEYLCEYCGLFTYKHTNFQQHIKTVHLGIHKNETPDVPASSTLYGNSPIDIVDKKTNIYLCEYCGIYAHTHTNLEYHIGTDHLRIHKNETIDISAAPTLHDNTLIESVVKNLKDYLCEHCGHLAYRRTHLANHIRAIHLKLHKSENETIDVSAVPTLYDNSPIETVDEPRNQEKAKNYLCEYCGLSAYMPSDIKRHIQAVHLKIRNFKCNFCDFCAYQMGTVRNHMKLVHHKWKVKQCEFCGYSTTYAQKLKCHIEAVHHKVKKYKCRICDYSAYQHATIRFHIKSIHQNFKNLKCAFCDYYAYQTYQLRRHVHYVHHKNNDQNCKLCEEDTSTSQVSTLNIQSESFIQTARVLKCEHCDFCTTKVSSLQHHLYALHFDHSNYKCQNCEYAALKASELENHITVVHQKNKVFKCKNCDFATFDASHLKKHISMEHQKNRKFKCKHCECELSSGFGLKNHIKAIHDKIKDFKCGQCNFATSRSSTLNSHIKAVHIKTKDFKCSLCDYCGTQKKYLRDHIRVIHNNIRPHKCKYCDYTGATTTYLKRHVASIHLKQENKS